MISFSVMAHSEQNLHMCLLPQRDLWPGPWREAGRTGLYVSDDPELPAVVEAAFARCSALPVVPAVDADGRVIRLLRGYLCEDFRPVDWPEPGKY